MKFTLIFIAWVGSLIVAQGQGFEGTMKWKMTMAYSDPKMKARAEEAARKMNDPAVQQRMMQMKKQMEDPKMKELMERNPQMKAQMEQMMAATSSSGEGLIPTGLTVKMKNGNVLSKMEGGMMSQVEVLFIKAKEQTIRLDRTSKTYTVMPAAKAPANKGNIKVTQTTEQKRILNYNCVKYLVVWEENEKTLNQTLWVTDEIKDWDITGLLEQHVGKGGVFPPEIKGVPLQIEVLNPGGTMIMEVTEISRAPLNDSDFVVPSDFKSQDKVSVK